MIAAFGGDKESDVFRKRRTLAVISYLLTRVLLSQRWDWRLDIREPLCTGVASLITVLSLTMGGGLLSVFRALSVGFDALLTCLHLSRCPGKWLVLFLALH